MSTAVTSFRQVVTLNASASDIYEMLMDSRKHTKLTGSKATISRKPNGAFTVYDNYAYGRNIALVENKKIVQSWRANEPAWPADVMSEVTFSLIALGRIKTKLTFTHKNIPVAVADNFKKGWVEFYWNPLRAHYNGNR
jgi:activator of HSP90 ATPase